MEGHLALKQSLVRQIKCLARVVACLLRLGYAGRLSDGFDCVACGACCYGRQLYVQVFSNDVETLGPALTEEYVTQPVGLSPASDGRAAEPHRFMKMAEGHCAALRIVESKQFLCRVYEDRPTLCRAFKPGSQCCLEARARHNVDARNL